MKQKWILSGLLLVSFLITSHAFAHEGHHHASEISDISALFLSDSQGVPWNQWMSWLGSFHFLILHFPIALIVMTVAAELLWFLFKNPVFDHAARFMILAAAIFAVPTALLGLSLGYGNHYEGELLNLYTWHRAFGLATAALAVVTAILREGYTRHVFYSLTGYYIALAVLFVLVSLTGTFGGEMTFGKPA
jgi:uncharacterized membrane protein